MTAHGLTLAKHGATAVTHFRLAANTTPVTPPTLPPGTSARAALLGVQADLGQQLSLATWGSQSAPGGTGNLNAVNAIDSSHVWAAGASCTLLFGNGTTWTKDANVPASCTSGAVNLTGVDVQDNGHGWAVGTGGVVLVCNANCNTATATWTQLTGGSFGSASFTGVWGNGNTVYAVSGTALWVCSANCNATQVGSGGGKATWTGVTGLGALAAVYALGGGTPAFAVGSGGLVRVCKTAPCNVAASWIALSGFGSASFTSVFALDGNNVFAVGSSGGNGLIWACSNGCNNTVVGTGGGQAAWGNITPSAPSPVPPPFTGVGGAGGGGGSVWAVGAGGAIWFCGNGCSSMPTAWVAETRAGLTGNFAAVTASDPNHAWTVGAGGVIRAATAGGPPTDAIQKALTVLGIALTPALWLGTDGNHIDPNNFHKVFDNGEAAVQAIDGLKNPPATWVPAEEKSIEGAMRLLATTEIADNSCSPQKAKELTTAQKELDAGDQEWSKGHADEANEHYGNAYDHGNKAQGVPCSGISVSPVGTLFSQTNIVPGDSFPTPAPGATDSVLVKIAGSAGSVKLSAGNFTFGTNGDLAPYLTIQVTEYAAGSTTTVLHTYPTQSLQSLATAINLASQDGTGTWAINESHYLVITVALPASVGNAAQGKDTTFDLNWTRS